MELSGCVVSLGCSKNLVDSEIMSAQLVHLGYAMTDSPADASLLLVNTCGFLESAVQEAIDIVLKMASHRTRGRCRCLIVAGCMVQRYGKKIVRLLPEVDLFLGTSHFHELKRILRAWQEGDRRKLWIASPRYLMDCDTPRRYSTNFYSVYIKIAEGCSNRCSFCLIPNLRGALRSRSVKDILTEASRCAEQGVKEINLIAQDTTAFGFDLGDRHALERLLTSMEQLRGIEWIRLLYTYPARITEGLLRLMAQSRKIVPYLDIPLQHCVPKILKAMERESPHLMIDELIAWIRSYIPDIALRTTLMVGFPGETDEDFEELVEFVERIKFDHVGVFSFSIEAGTRAARMPLQVDDDTKELRRRILLANQQRISKRLLTKKVGATLPVLIEGPHPETDLLLAGRLATQAPEVDGNVLITSGMARQGEIRQAGITEAHEYDLVAELL
ncbi:MAG: 30S ribosomal protein S12 methylthiotransferase RimO [Syntrophobacteraceae bacterium]